MQAGNTASIATANASAGTGHTGTDPNDRASGSGYTVETGMSTAHAEALGDATTNAFNEMAFSVENIAVTAVSRALKAEYMELAQDLGTEALTLRQNFRTFFRLRSLLKSTVKLFVPSTTPLLQVLPRTPQLQVLLT